MARFKTRLDYVDALTGAERTLLESVARAIVSGDRGDLRTQLDRSAFAKSQGATAPEFPSGGGKERTG